jgi:N-acetylglutamate synthase/N-acetylornithine aminotransferase
LDNEIILSCLLLIFSKLLNRFSEAELEKTLNEIVIDNKESCVNTLIKIINGENGNE